jgi:hypothetical protein
MTFGGWKASSYGDSLNGPVTTRVVYPIDDLRPHILPDSEADGPCWCNPTDDEGVTVHHSLDGREMFETGERRPS